MRGIDLNLSVLSYVIPNYYFISAVVRDIKNYVITEIDSAKLSNYGEDGNQQSLKKYFWGSEEKLQAFEWASGSAIMRALSDFAFYCFHMKVKYQRSFHEPKCRKITTR